jgi:hypothetical protein
MNIYWMNELGFCLNVISRDSKLELNWVLLYKYVLSPSISFFFPTCQSQNYSCRVQYQGCCFITALENLSVRVFASFCNKHSFKHATFFSPPLNTWPLEYTDTLRTGLETSGRGQEPPTLNLIKRWRS